MTDAGTIRRLRTDANSVRREIDACVAALVAGGSVLGDPQNLRPLPLSGIPGWHADSTSERFFNDAPCFRPLRPGRRYPAVDTL